MCQDEDENEGEYECFRWFWGIFIIVGDERISTSSMLRTNESTLIYTGLLFPYIILKLQKKLL